MTLRSRIALSQPFDPAGLQSVNVCRIPNPATTLRNFNHQRRARLSRAHLDETNRIAGAELEKIGYRRA
ncbi:MAG: hypothetical protein ABI629_10645 [bacterium]